mmetsp:Transcript_65747/g.130262  ORF Transcript_65747/g.130262 Transcript_65747/m.130262 type:complete len:96 (+) Transcript_65747:577-864(+)
MTGSAPMALVRAIRVITFMVVLMSVWQSKLCSMPMLMSFIIHGTAWALAAHLPMAVLMRERFGCTAAHRKEGGVLLKDALELEGVDAEDVLEGDG